MCDAWLTNVQQELCNWGNMSQPLQLGLYVEDANKQKNIQLMLHVLLAFQFKATKGKGRGGLNSDPKTLNFRLWN